MVRMLKIKSLLCLWLLLVRGNTLAYINPAKEGAQGGDGSHYTP